MRNVLRCHQAHAELSQLPPGVPPPESLKSHFEACKRCRSEWELEVHAHQALSHYSERQAIPRPDSAVRLALMEKIRAEEPVKAPQKRVAPVPSRRPALAMGAAVAVACGIAWTAFHPKAGKPVASGIRVANLFGTPQAPAPVQPTERSGTRPPDLLRPMVFLPAEGVNHLLQKRAAGRKNPGTETPLFTKEERGEARTAPQRVTDDLAYINDAAMPSLTPETRRKIANEIGHGDDFITVPRPQLAANDTPATRRIVGEAVKQYEDEKAIVDDRLFKKADVELKGGDLRELLDALTQKTGVKFFVAKDLEDLKLTVLVKQVPARDLMRQVVRLFNLQWRRRGEEGKYTYELVQDLKQKLAEEELKRKDDDQMLLNLVDEMEPYLQYKNAPGEQIKSLADEAKQKAGVAGSLEERRDWLKRERIFSYLAQPEHKNVLNVYAMLTPEQLVNLRNGQEITFTYKGDGSENSLPKEMADDLQSVFAGKSFGGMFRNAPPEKTSVSMGFSLNRTQPGNVDLVGLQEVSVKRDNGSSMSKIGNDFMSGQPDRLRDPKTAQAHAADRSRPEFKGKVTLDPQSQNPEQTAHNPLTEKWLKDAKKEPGVGDIPADSRDWLESSDVLANLHQKTGRNIIADYYTRVYPRSFFATNGETLLDALNSIVDALQSEWQEDGGFLRIRRYNYYAERTMDVPNPLLVKWKAARDSRGYLNLDDLAEIAMLPQDVLQHGLLQRAVQLKYGLDEWQLGASGKDTLKMYAALTLEQKREVQTGTGIALASLTAAQAETFRSTIRRMTGFKDEDLATGRLYIAERKPGSYEWIDMDDHGQSFTFPVPITVQEASREAAEAKVTALVNSIGASPELLARANGNRQEILDRAKEGIAGPEAGIWTQLQAGDSVMVRQNVGGSTSSSNVKTGKSDGSKVSSSSESRR